MIHKGVCNGWLPFKGYGWFIDMTKGTETYGRLVFCHVKNWTGPVPSLGQDVEFEIGEGIHGHRIQAINARFASTPVVLP